jgi:tetratricopeptide (TPR) repeat protein/transcriptional regulator with XRE-family HTH domain
MLAMPDDAVANGAAKRRSLAQRRKAVGLTQEQLAGQLGVERTTVVRWERGTTQPLPWLRPKLASVLKVSADRLGELLSADPAHRDGAAPTVPRQLPATVADFIGRAAELRELTRMLNQARAGAPGTVVISAIGGTAGVGKTALAVHWAHQAAGQFPDGQLYVNMRGYDPARPMPAGDALAGFLGALGVPGQDIPPGLGERAAQYRSLVAGKRMLIVLDNASEVEQVRPLLPGTRSCAVVVTSRDSLAGLVARHGAARLDLDLLPLGDAVGLLRELIGARTGADPDATAELAAQCCRLPLALRVAAELTAARPGIPLSAMVGELADQQRRLDLLDADGDPYTAVRAVFSWSYRNLDAKAARAFRLAGLHPGPDFDLHAAAALTGTTLEQACRLLDVLARAHLIQTTGPGRHGLHDLLRAYARELAVVGDRQDGQAALTRLFDHYLHTAAAAMDTLYPAEGHRRPTIPPPATPVAPVTWPDAARVWLDAQRPTLVAVTAHTADRGWPGHATRLSATLFRYLNAGSHHTEAITIHGHARAAARRADDRAAEVAALNNLGSVHIRQGEYQQARVHLRRALAMSRHTGDGTGQARALHNLGNVEHRQGRYQRAAGLFSQAVNIYSEIGDRFGEAMALDNLGIVRHVQGRYQEAIDHHRRSLALARKLDDLNGQAWSLDNLGTISVRQGRYQDAADSLRQALTLFRQAGNRIGEVDALANLGAVCLVQHHLPQAASHLQQALAQARETGDRTAEAEALNRLGEVLRAADQPGDARACHTAALELAGQTGDQYQQAQAHDGLGHACSATGDLDEARRQWQEALACYAELGVPEADQVRAKLANHSDVARADHKP